MKKKLQAKCKLPILKLARYATAVSRSYDPYESGYKDQRFFYFGY
jgi:hypothetical protein